MKDVLPVALGWVHPESPCLDWDIAQVRRLAERLGYRLVWVPEASRIPLADQVRAAGAEVVIAPSAEHFDFLALNSVMAVADVETVNPRLSFSRWATGWQPGREPK
ncbi:hypothetical protein [Nocardia aobensis]|uniref:hypothetical protein n=1 Tax=Nocardia aobensis TaxID=257277 RepID=UPI00030F8A1F|nr:hypothetical protein [Nocardia aobensis]